MVWYSFWLGVLIPTHCLDQPQRTVLVGTKTTAVSRWRRRGSACPEANGGSAAGCGWGAGCGLSRRGHFALAVPEWSGKNGPLAEILAKEFTLFLVSDFPPTAVVVVVVVVVFFLTQVDPAPAQFQRDIPGVSQRLFFQPFSERFGLDPPRGYQASHALGERLAGWN